MTDHLRIALAQLNPKVGDLGGNLELARKALADAVAAKADILMFSELFLTGYFPEDLLFKPQFVADTMAAAAKLVAETAGTGVSVLLPTVWQDGQHLRNAVLLAENGEMTGLRYKRDLPNDDVFYEKRYFTPGPLAEPFTIKGVTIGVPICEDIWHEEVCEHLVDQGARILLCPNGSPYWRLKLETRRKLVLARVRTDNVPLLYLNQVGGQDELVYDGASFGYEPGDRLVFQGKSFETDFILTDWARTPDGWRCTNGEINDLPSADEVVWRACVMGLRDYMGKNGFKSAVLGLSGGIDSAVVAAMAVDAVGPDAVQALMLPYRYTSEASKTDAEDCAQRLGLRYEVVSIGSPVDAVKSELAALFAARDEDLTEENMQSRMRGLVLMAVSNKFGGLLLTTGNKSEMSVGYATLYGDMNGGFNPLKDMLKMQVYRMAEWRNHNRPADALGPEGEVIPLAIIDKAPSAELRPNQTDQDSLPPYPVLDAILEGLVEEEASVKELVARGFDIATVKRIEKLLYIAEFKRRQSAPGVKLTKKALGLGRKYPITNGYRDESGA